LLVVLDEVRGLQNKCCWWQPALISLLCQYVQIHHPEPDLSAGEMLLL